MNARELRAKRAALLEKAQALVEAAEAENRDLTQEEQTQYDDLISEADSVERRYTRLEALPGSAQGNGTENRSRQAPFHNRTRLGDSEERAMAHWVRTGDLSQELAAMAGEPDQDERRGGVRGGVLELRLPSIYEERAAVDSTMNITTAADGANLVPTTLVNRVITRRAEVRLAERLGVQMVPGVGTTVEVPYESTDAQPFATTAEQSDAHDQNYERDAGQVLKKSLTLVKKTKKLEITEELLDDEDANLMGFIGDRIGRGIGITHNGLLLTEVAAYGTAFKTFAAAAAIADGEVEDIIYHNTLAFYLDDGGSLAWVMRPPTFGVIKKISGEPRIYGDSMPNAGRNLLEYPTFFSSQAAAIAATAKSVYFGNWNYVGMREAPALRIIRDIYSVDGMVVLKYSFRTVYGVLQAGAVGYGVHPSA